MIGMIIKESSEDWGQSFDDMDGVDWANHMGGPDDDEIERYYDNVVHTYEEEHYSDPLGYDEEGYEEQEMDEEESEYSISRMEEVVEWLSVSKLAKKFRSKEGFFVPKGPHVRLTDGNVIDLIEWLFKEGIKGGVAVGGYSVVYSKSGSEYGEKLSFFKIVVDAPFSLLSKEDEVTALDDEIPF
jgi:hypothetical protein